jgi:chaperonin GroES
VKFIPLYERVLVKELEDVKSIDGFALPDNAREDFKFGVVISTGVGYRRENGDLAPTIVRRGMTVAFGPFAGTKIQVDGKEYLWMREGELGGFLCFKDEGRPCGACPECLTEEDHKHAASSVER